MAPLKEKLPNLKKSQSENFDSKTSRFSFRWFLKRSKSSKTTKEMTSAEKAPVPTIVMSKSCESEMTNFKFDKYPTALLWKLLPNRGKMISETDKTGKRKDGNFKLSYSCSDVHSIVPAPNSSSVVRSACSSYNIDANPEIRNGQEKNNSSQCLYNRCPRNASFDYSKVFTKSEKQETSGQFMQNAQQFVLCKLCLMMIPQQTMFVLQDCGCSFCLSCMQQYLLISIKEGNITIMCPDAECGAKGKVLVSEIQDLVGDEVFYKFQKYKLDRDVELDPFRTWCPTPGCETICQFYPSFNSETGVSVHCLSCKFTFCSSCKLRWHTNKTCEELKKVLQDEADFYSDDEDAIVKRCPNCSVPIERDEGCAQMMCLRCKHVFCWHCLSSLDDDFLLRHYDKGPCRNRLGHSRASMVWHRTQVVGIFAGFSFLLLVASPILLLAAPCLLCCRCKSCKFFYEEATPL